jgi:hypothetical protein
MLRYPLPKIGLGLGRIASRIQIGVTRSFESYFQEVSLIRAIEKTPAALKKYPEIAWILESARHIFKGTYPVFANTRCNHLQVQAKLIDQYTLLSEQKILAGAKETLLLLRKMKGGRVTSGLYLGKTVASLEQSRKTNTAVNQALWERAPLFREMIVINKKVVQYLQELEASIKRIEDIEELRYLREILSLVIDTASKLIENCDTRDMYGSLQNIALCMGFCGDAEYLYTDLSRRSRQIHEKQRREARKALRKEKKSTTIPNGEIELAESVESSGMDSQYPIPSKYEQELLDRLEMLSEEANAGRTLWIKPPRRSKILAEILALEQTIRTWDQRWDITNDASTLLEQIRAWIYALEVQDRVREIVSEKPITQATLSIEWDRKLSNLQIQWIAESERILRITRTVTSSKNNSQLQRDSFADGHFVTDFFHPFLRFMIVQLRAMPNSVDKFDMREILERFYQATARVTQNYTHTMIHCVNGLENTFVTEANDLWPLLHAIVNAYRENWIKDPSALQLLIKKLS